jgi:protein-disulfide isomerase
MSNRGDRNDAKRVVQHQLAKERRRQRTVLTSVAAIAVLVIGGLIGWAVLAGQPHDTVTTPAVAVDEGTGFAAGTGPVTIDIYEDFICPACGDFESSAGPAITQLVTDGKVTVVYHPIAILDRYSSTQYSTRAAAASAAAAQGGKFVEFHNALFARQPEENSAGLSDAALIEIGNSVGLSDAAFTRAVTDGTYRGWSAKVTDTASARGVTGTPTVLVAGKAIDRPTPEALTAAVAAAAA